MWELNPIMYQLFEKEHTPFVSEAQQVLSI